MAFKDTIQQLAAERGWSANEVGWYAHAIGGISPSSVRAYYYGQRQPGLRALRVLATVFDVSADRLLESEEVVSHDHARVG